MKKIYATVSRVVIALMAVMTLSTTNAMAVNDGDPEMVALLKEVVKETNAECPQDLGDGIIMNKLRLTQNYLVYEFITDSDYIEGLGYLQEVAPEETDELFMELLLSSGDETVLLMGICLLAERGIEIYATNYSNTQSVSLHFTTYDLAPYLEAYDFEQILDNMVDVYDM